MLRPSKHRNLTTLPANEQFSKVGEEKPTPVQRDAIVHAPLLPAGPS